MSHFTLKDLDFKRSRSWILESAKQKDTDPAYSFIAAWISFNHYYGTFASTHKVTFGQWTKGNVNGSFGDKAQWMYLVAQSEFDVFFKAFRSKHESLFAREVDLPVENRLTEKAVPDGITGGKKLSDLTTRQLFDVVYQIRNNLFHGEKDPFTSQRDAVLTRLGGQFTLLLASSLISETLGEVLNFYDIAQKEQIAAVAALLQPETKS